MILEELYSDIDFLCGSTSANYPITDKKRNINIHYADVARLIWSATDGWQYDDSNNTDFPFATTTMAEGQQDYTIPTTAQRIRRFEVKDNGGTWHKLEEKSIEDIRVAFPEFESQNGLPRFYTPVGRSVLLSPKPSSTETTLSAGLRGYFDWDVTKLSANSATPGFATPYHRILSYGASIDFESDINKKENLLILKQRLENGLINFYSKRNMESTPRIKPNKGYLKYI